MPPRQKIKRKPSPSARRLGFEPANFPFQQNQVQAQPEAASGDVRMQIAFRRTTLPDDTWQAKHNARPQGLGEILEVSHGRKCGLYWKFPGLHGVNPRPAAVPGTARRSTLALTKIGVLDSKSMLPIKALLTT